MRVLLGPPLVTRLGHKRELHARRQSGKVRRSDTLAPPALMTRDDAYVLCSLAADLHVTQSVDQTKGVHATIAKSVFK